ncbi:phage/plasmid replication domain-containing protein [Flavobacterium macrobrachii]|uniref:Replication-associated protein G2P N-terminal domain-containing protein n=1 Tax=Flavobacterium macrobrachii TaxID=591204 RepID=A0ABS2CYZ0_9FLAO|nr:phage/plasmid replication protein [Flavobacterium macrobrachii]MBM6500195.1 hypothetical protein [Flavobacterium macrobrachii]
MIDTIKGYITLNQCNKSTFKDLLVNSKKTITKNGCTKTFNLSNFIITISFDRKYNPTKLSFNGSLPKFYIGNNLFHLDWNQTKDAIQMLSDNLNVDISKAILTRVDFGINIPLNHSIHEYTACLLAFPRLGTMRYKDSVTFFTAINNRSFIFYDKVKELNKGRRETKIDLQNKTHENNILRYEIQLKKYLNDRFRLKEVKVKDLFRATIQKKLIEYWYNGYQKVEKISLGTDPEYLLKNRNGLNKYLSYHGIEKIGYDRIISKISELEFEVKNNRSKLCKMRKEIKDLLREVKENSKDKNLINELDEKILYIKEYIFSNNSVPYFILENSF